MKKNTKSLGMTYILGALSVFFLVTTVGAYVFMDASMSELTETNKLLSYEMEELRKSNQKLSMQVTELETVEEDLVSYKEAVGQYFGLSEAINVDLDALTKTYQSFTADFDSETSLATVDTFATQLETLKEHGSEWETVLVENRVDFEAAGIDVDAEIAQMKTTIPQVEKSLASMKEHMAA